jgi:PAS domain S-box-containing protein
VKPSRPALTPFIAISLAVTVLLSVGWVMLDDLIPLNALPQPRKYLLAGGGAVASFLVMLLAVVVIRRRTREVESTEVQFQSLLEAAPDPIVIVNRSGSVVLVNTQAEQMFGYARHELLGKTFESLVYQDVTQGPDAGGSPWTTVTNGVEVSPLFVGRCKDGSRIFVEINFNPLETKTGPLLISTMRNITERRRREAHRAARQSVRRLLAEATRLEDAAPVMLQGICQSLGWDLGALWVVEEHTDQLTRTSLWHQPRPRAEDRGSRIEDRASGRSSTEAGNPGTDLLASVCKTGKPVWLPLFAHAASGVMPRPSLGTPGPKSRKGRQLALAFPVMLGKEVMGVLEFRDPAGHEPDEDVLETMANVGNQIGLFLHRRRAEQAVRQSEARKRAVLEAALDAIITIDQNGKVVDFNPAAEELFRCSRAAALGREMADLFLPPGGRDRFRAALAMFLATGDKGVLARREEMTGVRSDREQFPLELSLTPIPLDGPPLFTAYIRDVTERRRTEEALAQTEERFRQAQKMEAVGRLAGGVAHDFNNLLTVITGCTEILLGDFPQSGETQELLEEVQNAGKRAAKLTSQLLAFSRRQILAPKVLDLNTIVADMDRMLHRLIGEDIQMVTVQAEDLNRVKVDPGQIEQVIMNLVVNARDAMPTGGKLTIETANVELDEAYVRAYPELTPGPYVLLAVSDTGLGMSQEIKARLFEPFFTTKEVGKGTGLGLATVYGILKQSGGHIAVYTEPGHGTTFKVYLPCCEEPISELRRVQTPEPPQGAGTVLLVEDEDDVRTLTRRALTRQGYTVLEARHGVEALKVWEQHKGAIDLMVSDLVMPEMNGGELARRLLHEQPDLKVLFLSGYSDSAVLRANLLEEGRAFLQKPFTPRVLARKVHELMTAPPPGEGESTSSSLSGEGGWAAEDEACEVEPASCS